MRLRYLALAAAVAAAPLTASAVTFDPANNIAPGTTNLLAFAPYFFDATFSESDVGGSLDFTFENQTLGVAGVTISEGTVLQNTLDFLGGVTVEWLNAGKSVFIPEGTTMGYSLDSVIAAGASDTLRITFGDPKANIPGGMGDIDFDILVRPIPLPASLLMLAGALGGLALIRRRRSV